MAQCSQSKVSLSVCRIRKLLSGDQGKATIGGGCIVSWTPRGKASNPSEAPKSIPVLITTTQVVNKNDLISPSVSIVVEFLDKGKLLTFNLGFKCASDFPDPIPGRVLGGTVNSVSFMVIPVEKFDDRNVFKRTYSSLRGSSFEKRSLSCSYQSDENLKSAISSRQVLSHVIRDGAIDASYKTEPYCLVGKEISEFALTSPLDHDDADDKRHLKEFNQDEKPKGAPLLGSDGKFVGMLAIVPSEERNLFPLFLPTLTDASSSPLTAPLSKADWNSTERDCVLVTSDITVKPQTSTGVSGGSDQDVADESCSQEDRNKSTANNNQNVTYQDRNPGNCITTMQVQGSGNPVANSMQLDGSSPECSANPDAEIPHEDQPRLLTEEEQVDLVEQDPASGCSSLEQDDEPQSDPPEELLSLNSNENVHMSQTRPNLLKENSCYDEPFDSTSVKDQEEYPYGVDETASPKQQMLEAVSEETTDASSSQESGGDLELSLEGGDPYLRRSFSDIFSSNAFSQPVRPSTIRRNTTPRELERFSPGSLVKETIVSNAKVMDTLSLYLDRSLCPGSRDAPLTQRWEHLADVFKVPYERKKQCENFTGKLSPSENMFEYLCTTRDFLPIKIVKDKLKELKRNDVVAELDNSSILADATVTDLCEKHSETLNAVCLMLDDKHSLANWQDLGLKLGISGGELWKFKDPSGDSPSELIFRKIKSKSPELRISTIEAAFAEEELNLPAIAKVLNDLPDGSTIETLLNDLDILDKVTAMLDRRERSWYKFGWKFKMDITELDSLKPDPIQSPTQLLMTYIVQDKPDLAMKTFLETLATIERYDVIKELKKFFHPNDIDDIVRRMTP